MHLVVNTAGQQVQAFGVDFFVGPYINGAVYPFNKTVLNQQVCSELFAFINYSSGFDEDSGHEANIVSKGGKS
jgi:hypothetical protein